MIFQSNGISSGAYLVNMIPEKMGRVLIDGVVSSPQYALFYADAVGSLTFRLDGQTHIRLIGFTTGWWTPRRLISGSFPIAPRCACTTKHLSQPTKRELTGWARCLSIGALRGRSSSAHRGTTRRLFRQPLRCAHASSGRCTPRNPELRGSPMSVLRVSFSPACQTDLASQRFCTL